MVDINTIEYASEFGAHDADAVTDGSGFDARTARGVAMQANRLIIEGQQAFNCVWPEYTSSVEGVAQYPAEWPASVGWTLLVPPIPVEKMPGLVTGTIHFRANIPTGIDVIFAAETGAETRGRAEKSVACTGTGAFANYSISGVRFLPGTSDEVRIYQMSGDPEGALMSEATYGTHQAGTLVFGTDDFQADNLTDASAAWNTGATSISNQKHVISMIYDYGGAYPHVAFVASVVWNTATRIGWLRPPGPQPGDIVTNHVMDDAVIAFHRGATFRYEIRTAAEFALSQVLCVLDSRPTA